MSALYHDARIILAPMAGVSDRAFRQICLEHGAQLTFTEMVSAKGLAFANAKTQHLLRLAPNEKRVSVQLFGHEPNTLASEAAKIEESLGSALYSIDINMGCPARKIAGKGDGSALMKDPDLAASIVRSVSKAVQTPVTAKFRRGYYEGEETCVEFALRMEEAGASAVVVHGRYATQLYRGKANWDAIARVKRALTIPVVGNGDVKTGEDARELVNQTGCDAIMVGRGTQGNPWVFQEVKAALDGIDYKRPSLQKRMDVAIRHTQILAPEGSRAVITMRKHGMWYVSGTQGASQARQKLSQATTAQEFVDIFSSIARECGSKHE